MNSLPGIGVRAGCDGRVIAALANPMVGATCESLVMRSIESPGAPSAARPAASVQSNAVARELLLLCARCAALLCAWALTSLVGSPTHMVLVMLLMTIALLPLE